MGNLFRAIQRFFSGDKRRWLLLGLALLALFILLPWLLSTTFQLIQTLLYLTGLVVLVLVAIILFRYLYLQMSWGPKKYCMACGRRIAPIAKYCPYCGKRLPSDDSVEEESA